jgi:hypothetical protein
MADYEIANAIKAAGSSIGYGLQAVAAALEKLAEK